MSAALIASLFFGDNAAPVPDVPDVPDTLGPFSATAFGITGASASIHFATDGKVYIGEASFEAYNPLAEVGTWNGGVFPSSAYDVRATVTSGLLNFGDPTDTWLNVSASRYWGVGGAAVSTFSAEFTVEVRDAATLAVLLSVGATVYSEAGT